MTPTQSSNIPVSPAELHELLLLFQERRRKLRRSSPAGKLSMREAQVLLELDGREQVSVTELAHLLSLDQGNTSRLVGTLLRRGLISKTASNTDRRSSSLSLTVEGQGLVKELDDSQEKILLECLSSFQHHEHLRFVGFLERLANAFAAGPARTRFRDHPITVQLRRISRIVGLDRGCLSDDSLTSTQYRIMKLLASSEGRTLGEISGRVSLDASSVTRAVRMLEKQGFVSRQERGREAALLRLSAKGKRLLDREESAVNHLYAPLLESLPSSELEEFGALLRAAAGLSEAAGHSEPAVMELRDDEALRAARALLVEDALRTSRHYHLPAEIFSPKSRSFAVIENGRMLIAAEFARTELRNLALAGDVSRALKILFLQTLPQELAALVKPLLLGQ